LAVEQTEPGQRFGLPIRAKQRRARLIPGRRGFPPKQPSRRASGGAPIFLNAILECDR
jgi:hypothetical protein